MKDSEILKKTKFFVTDSRSQKSYRAEVFTINYKKQEVSVRVSGNENTGDVKNIAIPFEYCKLKVISPLGRLDK
jgi:hypothetical protein